ncbi:MAG: thiamine ABC transporter substrate-binding protein [Anaerolineae bacterium]|nr:thiamine ABC transporter substrate-binding protein [Anaerolineae bacterium]MDW8069303.1 thiamine ABC transporter substrate-binding protein [Anaerolineae bacterium]
MKRITLALLVGLLGLTACGPQEPATLTVMTHDSFAASEEVIQAFEQENNVKVTFLASGDTGAALNKAILSKDAPLADVFYGVDNTFLSRALEADIFEPYRSPLLKDIPAEFQLDPEFRALPVDYGDVCINYDKAYFAEHHLPIPQSLEDLTRPEYRGLLVVENPATSSPGLAFLLATIAHFGDPGYLEYWRALRENGVVVAPDWETAYYTHFSGSSGRGPQPMVVSYGSSPPAEVIFAEQPLEEAPTASLVGPGMCFRQIEFVGILKGTRHRTLAQKFVDFMLSVRFQEDMPLQMFVFPVNPQAKLPEAFVRYAQIPEQPARLDPAVIAAHREQWIQAWTETVLK